MNDIKYYTSRETSNLLGKHPNTLRRWHKEGIIEAVVTPAGQRLYDISKFTTKRTKIKNSKEIYYCRVSSKKQFNDLDTQITFMQKQFPNCTIVSDIGSGINWKRKGFISILEQSMQGNIKKIIIAHRDRLCRFAFEFVEWLFNKYGVELMVLNKEDKNTTKNELAEDLLSIIHIFSCRENGKRRYSRKN